MSEEWKIHIGVGQQQYKFGVLAGTDKETLVRREDNGKIGGKQTEHWDGRVDATIIAPTIIKNLSTGETSVKL